jgi:hypothetical protein
VAPNPPSRIIRHPDGVACTCVTPASWISRTNAAGSRASRSVAMTVRPPVISGRNSSTAEMSNDADVCASHVSPGPASSRSRNASSRLASWACGTSTPFGRPVEPEVYST